MVNSWSREPPVERVLYAASLRAAVVLHRAEYVAFGSLEEHQRSDSDDHRPRHHGLAAAGEDGFLGLVDRGDPDRALESGHRLSRHELPPALQRAHDAGRLALGVCLDLVEVRRSPGAEHPAEDAFVECPGPREILGIDGEVCDVWHGSKCTRGGAVKLAR